MDVVNLPSPFFCQKVIQHRLQPTHRQLPDACFKTAVLLLSLPVHKDKAKAVGGICHHGGQLLGGVHFRQLTRQPVLAEIHQGGGITVKQHPMNRLEGEATVVDVHNFHQGIPKGTISQVRWGFSRRQLVRLVLIPHSLCGGKGMVAVSHRKEEHIAVLASIFHRQLLQGSIAAIQQRSLHGIPHNASGTQHQVPLIQGSRVLGMNLVTAGIHQTTSLVVHQQHDVGQLQGGATTNLHAGRNAVRNGSLRGTNKGLGAGLPLIGLQIHRRHQALPDTTVCCGSLQIHKTGKLRTEDVSRQVLLHGLPDGGNPLVLIIICQIHLRQNQ